jgi:hypothetical protein
MAKIISKTRGQPKRARGKRERKPRRSKLSTGVPGDSEPFEHNPSYTLEPVDYDPFHEVEATDQSSSTSEKLTATVPTVADIIEEVLRHTRSVEKPGIEGQIERIKRGQAAALSLSGSGSAPYRKQELDGTARSLDSAATAPRRIGNEATALAIVNEYLSAGTTEMIYPTQSGLEKFAAKSGWIGGRNFLRSAFSKSQGSRLKVGRPRNSPK